MAEQIGIMSKCLKSLDGLTYTNQGRNLKTNSVFNDFIETVNPFWTAVSAGGGGSYHSPIANVEDHPGQLYLNVTNPVDMSGISTAGIFRDEILFGSGQYTFETEIIFGHLSTAIDEYVFYSGFGDTITGDQVDGAYFKYDRTISVNWLACTASNSVRTVTDTGIPFVNNAWIKLKIVVNENATTVRFYINDNLVATNLLNIPTVNRYLGLLQFILKTVGANVRFVAIDWSWFHYDLVTSR